MKNLIRPWLLAALLFCPFGAAAQSVNDPETGSQVEFNDETFEEGGDYSGVASYNIEEENWDEFSEEGWDEAGGDSYTETRTETIRVYSGRQEGNNMVRTIEVPLPEGAGSFSYREYQPQ